MPVIDYTKRAERLSPMRVWSHLLMRFHLLLGTIALIVTAALVESMSPVFYAAFGFVMGPFLLSCLCDFVAWRRNEPPIKEVSILRDDL